MFKRILPTVFAMLAGFLVLLGSFLPVDALVAVRTILLQWATVVGAFALVVASLSVLRVHLTRLFRSKRQKSTSLLVVAAAIASAVLVFVEGSDGPWAQPLLHSVMVPGESALLALTAVTLIVAGMRILRTRRGVAGVVFVIAAVFVLLTSVIYIYPSIMRVIRDFVDAVAAAGMRGILIGVALGVTLTGLRIILGIDRPHSGEG
jgi:hypothetical protein